MNTEKKKRGLLFVISGPSGSGKGTIIDQLMKTGNYEFSVSATTRPPRPGEIDGVHYFFISREAFDAKIKSGEMLEYAEYVGNLYGTPRDAVEKCLSEGKNIILDIEGTGAKNVKAKMPDSVMIMILPPDIKTLEGRLRGRGTENEEIIKKRLDTAVWYLENREEYDYVIINETDKIDEAAGKIICIEQAEKARIFRNAELKEIFLKGDIKND